MNGEVLKIGTSLGPKTNESRGATLKPLPVTGEELALRRGQLT